MSVGVPPTHPTRRELLAATAPAAGARRTDAGRLARLVDVERLTLYCYDQVLAGTHVGAATHATLTELRGHALAHVAALSGALRARGGQPPPGPASVAGADRDLARRRVSGRLGQLRGARDALYLLLALERIVLGAYYVALLEVADPSLAGRLAQMMANDAQHEAILHEQLHPGDVAGAIPYGLVQGTQ